jgi:hypothetical protein
MMRMLSVTVMFGLLVGSVRGQDEKTYTIKFKKEADRARVLKTDGFSQKLKITDNDGKILKQQDEKKGDEEVYTETILERKDKKVLQRKRQYTKARIMTGGKTKTLPYEGKMVLIQKKGDRFTFRIEGDEELTGEDASQLESEFNRKKDRPSDDEIEKFFLPKRAVKVGESWKLDPTTLAKLFPSGKGIVLDTQKTTALGRLSKVYRKDRRQFGVISVEVKMVPKAIEEGGKEIPLTPASKVTMTMKLDLCIDGSVSTGTFNMDMLFHAEALFPAPDQPMVRLFLDVEAKIHYQHVEQ